MHRAPCVLEGGLRVPLFDAFAPRITRAGLLELVGRKGAQPTHPEPPAPRHPRVRRHALDFVLEGGVQIMLDEGLERAR